MYDQGGQAHLAMHDQNGQVHSERASACLEMYDQSCQAHLAMYDQNGQVHFETNDRNKQSCASSSPSLLSAPRHLDQTPSHRTFDQISHECCPELKPPLRHTEPSAESLLNHSSTSNLHSILPKTRVSHPNFTIHLLEHPLSIMSQHEEHFSCTHTPEL
jgi:hypothetical protein